MQCSARASAFKMDNNTSSDSKEKMPSLQVQELEPPVTEADRRKLQSFLQSPSGIASGQTGIDGTSGGGGPYILVRDPGDHTKPSEITRRLANVNTIN